MNTAQAHKKMRETTAEKTVRLKRLIQVGKKQLEMADESYRAMLKSVTRKDSTKGMTVSELESVVSRLVRLGFRIKAKPDDRVQAQDRQAKKIRALWLELATAKLVRDSSETALAAYVKRQTGVEALQWLSSEQASQVIEALKKWQGRKPSN
jgi:phage gp16-like protein